jgi:hypothetical protein
MFKQNKWEAWWDSLSPQMQEYLKITTNVGMTEMLLNLLV